MIRDFAILLSLQLAGEVIARGTGLPVPGPVLGLGFLLVGLLILRRGGRERLQGLDGTADRLIANLGILFVPAGVGVIRQVDLVATHGGALLLVLVASLVATLLVAVGTFRLVARFGVDATERS